MGSVGEPSLSQLPLFGTEEPACDESFRSLERIQLDEGAWIDIVPGWLRGQTRVFETLLSVQGVGPRVAVAILSGIPLPDLVRAISGQDLARLTLIRGVGRKIAERLVVELRDKIAAAALSGRPGGGSAPASPGIPAGRLGEVHGALVALGYRPGEFEAVLPTLDAREPTPELVKQALAALRRK